MYYLLISLSQHFLLLLWSEKNMPQNEKINIHNSLAWPLVPSASLTTSPITLIQYGSGNMEHKQLPGGEN